ncbi:hypothetical protein WN982_30245 [Paraburkholderia sp. IMGN_8]|uniref:hypothetical protein n=1 Tax=Paraburkholderia sp. IMGN_8 TaxID=3136564 RepID=UPI003100AA60
MSSEIAWPFVYGPFHRRPPLVGFLLLNGPSIMRDPLACEAKHPYLNANQWRYSSAGAMINLSSTAHAHPANESEGPQKAVESAASSNPAGNDGPPIFL